MLQDATSKYHAEDIKKTPLFIFVCADTTRMAEGQGTELWVQDLSAVSENILLAAHAMGLGACWTTIYPIISNLLKGRMRTIQKAYQPTIEFYTIVHSTFFVYKSSSERRIEKELKESAKLTILYNIHFTSFSKPTFQKQRFRTQR